MTAFLYIIEDGTNGFSYVGKTIKEPVAYWRTHRWFARRGSNQRPLLYRAMRQHGIENFTFTVVAAFDTDLEAQLAERYWIERLQLNRSIDQRARGYNLTDGGDGHAGFRQSAETRRRRAEKQVGRRRPKWTRPHPMKGCSPSAETRAKMAAAKRGKPSSRLGKKLTVEQRARLSESLKGRAVWNKGVATGPLSAVTRERMSAARRGRPNAGAFAPGQRAHNKTPDDVLAVLRTSTESNVELARRFGMHPKTIGRLRKT